MNGWLFYCIHVMRLHWMVYQNQLTSSILFCSTLIFFSLLCLCTFCALSSCVTSVTLCVKTCLCFHVKLWDVMSSHSISLIFACRPITLHHITSYRISSYRIRSSNITSHLITSHIITAQGDDNRFHSTSCAARQRPFHRRLLQPSAQATDDAV